MAEAFYFHVTREPHKKRSGSKTGMGVLPLQFPDGVTAQTLGLTGTEAFDVLGLSDDIAPRQDVTLRITRKDGSVVEQTVKLRIDTPIEVDYFRHGAILSFVLRQLLS
jgi:aconitate hydratase